MNRENLQNALDQITPTPEVQDRLYNQIMQTAKDKSALSKHRLQLFKRKMDRSMPLVAACLLVLVGFCVYGVRSGIFTGGPAVSEKELGRMIAAQEELAPQNQIVTPNHSSPPTNSTAAPRAATEIRPLVSAYAAIDVGFTELRITDIPADAFLFWDELVRQRAVPQGIALDSYYLEDGVLTLSFSQKLQELLNTSATSYFVTAMAKSFYNLYPEITQLHMQSQGAAITFGGSAIDATALMSESISITHTKSIQYGEAYENSNY